ncbi:ShlB/FhaC/HecB family hemolysin secretion/activation protein [Sulfurimonas sp.]|uniref:ShlB/FhaC/HecB family hemolysin secretion/activation protein n=1 Tax=Sulfurimonas sp. TaxID=2022749 RepID=UPI0025F9BBE2|nr:ShlB/FhaC/HecB family hemolysin secretion/activation protein [Sulfurimonas sp.]
MILIKKLFLTIIMLILTMNIQAKDCIKLEQIDVDDSEILDFKNKEELLKDFYGKCIKSDTLKNILNTLSQYYIDSGYITTKAYLKEQSILNGKMDISVSIGTIEDIVDANTSKTNNKIKTAFALQKNKPLNLRDLETSLEMMNRVPSTESKFEVKPGTKHGSSIVEIKTTESFPLHLNIGVSGEKNVYDEDMYLTAVVSLDNPLNINDVLTFTNNGSRVQQDYQSLSGKELNYSFPIGSYLFEFIWFDFSYKQKVLGLNDTYVSKGTTVGSTIKVSKILFRNKANKIKLSLSIQHKNTKNYFSNKLLEVSSYSTTLGQLNLTHTYVQSWGQLISIYSFYRGMNWFGARNDSYFTGDTEEKLQFTKHTLSEYLYYYLPDNTYQMNSNLYVQYTEDLLYNNDRLRVGSYYTVRGYEYSYYGDTGAYLKNDLIKTFYPDLNPTYIKTISPFIGLDYGYVSCQDTNEGSCGDLLGSAIGFKTDSQMISSDFTLSRALKKVENLDIETLFRYNINIEF